MLIKRGTYERTREFEYILKNIFSKLDTQALKDFFSNWIQFSTFIGPKDHKHKDHKLKNKSSNTKIKFFLEN